MTYAEWFLKNGIRVFPIKPRDKVPACKSWDDYIANPALVHTWVNYGVVLGHYEGGGGLAVVDTDNDAAEAWAAHMLPYTPFMVRTGKGVHRYYRIAQRIPNFIHRDGHTIEFRNQGQYVVGPGSIHETGKIYIAQPWDREFKQIPLFPVNEFVWDDRQGVHIRGIPVTGDGYKPPRVVHAGERHDQMYRILRSFQSRGVPDAACIEICVAMNRHICKPPLDEHEVRAHLTRVCKMPDRQGWARRRARSGWDIIMGLIDHDAELGEDVLSCLLVPREVALYAARAVQPDFDPEKGPPTDPDSSAKHLAGDADEDEERPYIPGEAFDLEDNEQDLPEVEE